MYDPWREIRRLQEEMDRLFSSLIRMEGVTFREPRVDIVEDEGNIVLTVELPGMSKEDVELYVNRDSVTIKATKRMKERREGAFYTSVSSFYKVIPLPEPVVPEETRATMKHGVLEIVLKKERTKKPEGHRVEIE